MKSIIRAEKQGAINGVSGRFHNVVVWPDGESRWSGRLANQTWVSEARAVEGYGEEAVMQVYISHDDNCKNGHEEFSITATVRKPRSRRAEELAGGCLHDEIAQVFPELKSLIRWHLVSVDGPLHYIANTVYLASEARGKARELDAARRSAVWPEATDEQLSAPSDELTSALEARLRGLLVEFRRDIEEAGFLFTRGAEDHARD